MLHAYSAENKVYYVRHNLVWEKLELKRKFTGLESSKGSGGRMCFRCYVVPHCKLIKKELMLLLC